MSQQQNNGNSRHQTTSLSDEEKQAIKTELAEIREDRRRRGIRYPPKAPIIENGPTGPLTAEDRERFDVLCHTIDAGLVTWYRVGWALNELRVGRYYRETHQTWAKFIEARFGKKIRWARQQIQSANLVARIAKKGHERAHLLPALTPFESTQIAQDAEVHVPELFRNEFVTRQLLRLIGKEGVDIPATYREIDEHQQAGLSVTAKYVKSVVSRVLTDAKAKETSKPEKTPQGPSRAVQEAPVAPLPVAKWESGEAAYKALNAALRDLCRSPDGIDWRSNRDEPTHLNGQIYGALRRIKEHLRRTRPVAWCVCKDKKSSCTRCRNKRWLSEAEYKG
jgi:hypothetical protein